VCWRIHGGRPCGGNEQNRPAQVGGSGSLGLAYDPAGRLYSTDPGGVPTRMLYDGADVIAEYDGAGALLRRYVHGAGEDEPMVSYDAAGNRSWLLADAQGSIIALTNAAGAATAINTYDEYGRPGASNAGYFQYTGQGWLAQAGLGCERFSVSQWIGGCSGVQNGARSLLSGDGARGPA
jgi:YD repeat-containing protein